MASDDGEGRKQLVDIFTDGACSGNPGPGGWGAILRYGGVEKETVRRRGADHQQPHGVDGGDHGDRGAEAAVRDPPAHRQPISAPGITTWIHSWKKRGWNTADKKPVKNVDLWQRLERAIETHDVEWLWVKGHSGHAENERADELARLAIRQFKDASFM